MVHTAQQDQRQQEIECKRAQQAQKIENQRAEAERELAVQRAQDEALQSYLNQMSGLLLERDLRASEKGSEVRTLARPRTLTVLGRLDPTRKTALMQFLVEADLVQRVDGRDPIISLRGADLSDADLRGASLFGAELSGASLINALLTDADLEDADLSDANLRYADLQDAYLSFAFLRYADLSYADLSDADLSNADLSNTKASKEQLDQADSLEGATMPDGKVSFDEFEPALSLRASDHWSVNVEEKSTDQVSIDEYLKAGEISFTNPLHVFDLMNPSEPKKLPKKLPEPENAEEWVSWFQNHPNLDTSKPAPASVGDTPGMQIDVTVSTMLKNNSQDFPGQPCFPLYSLSDGSPIVWCGGGWKHRFVIVDVGGETVLIDASARSDRFDEFLPKAQKVLDSVEWKSG